MVFGSDSECPGVARKGLPGSIQICVLKFDGD